MKKLFLCACASLMLVFGASAQLSANSDESQATESSVSTDRNEVLNERLTEINEMDKSNLDFSEKKELRKEVRAIQKEMSDSGGTIYISVGAAIIIILLLIILL